VRRANCLRIFLPVIAVMIGILISGLEMTYRDLGKEKFSFHWKGKKTMGILTSIVLAETGVYGCESFTK